MIAAATGSSRAGAKSEKNAVVRRKPGPERGPAHRIAHRRARQGAAGGRRERSGLLATSRQGSAGQGYGLATGSHCGQAVSQPPAVVSAAPPAPPS
jgi:hypothetical protein